MWSSQLLHRKLSPVGDPVSLKAVNLLCEPRKYTTVPEKQRTEPQEKINLQLVLTQRSSYNISSEFEEYKSNLIFTGKTCYKRRNQFPLKRIKIVYLSEDAL